MHKTFMMMLTCTSCNATQTLINLPWEKLQDMQPGDRWDFTCPNCQVHDEFKIRLAATVMPTPPAPTTQQEEQRWP